MGHPHIYKTKSKAAIESTDTNAYTKYNFSETSLNWVFALKPKDQYLAQHC